MQITDSQSAVNGPSISTRQVLFACVMVIAVASLLNLNGVLYLVTGSERLVSLFVLAAAILAIYLTRGLLLRETARFLLLLGGFLALSSLYSVIFMSDIELRHISSFLATGLVVWSVSSATYQVALVSPDRLQRYITYTLAIAALSILATEQLTFLHGIISTATFRYSGVFGNPNEAGIVAAVSMAFCIAMFRKAGQSRFLVLAILSLVATVLTLSKTALLTVTIVLIAFLLMTFRHDKKISWWVRILAVLSLVAIFLFNTYSAQLEWFDSSFRQQRLDQISALLSGNITGWSTSNRIDMWLLAKEVIEDQHYVFGSGLGAMRNLSGESDVGVHSFYLVVAGEAGLPYLLLVLFAGAIYLWRVWKLGPEGFAYLAYLLILASDALGTHHVLDLRFHAFLLGFTLGGVRALSVRKPDDTHLLTSTPPAASQ